MKTLDKRKLTPDNSVAIPNDLIDKGYIKLFKKKDQLEAVLKLIQLAYKAGLEIGRDETRFYRK